MKVSATKLANDSKAILDRVITRGEAVEVQRHGKTVAEIRPKVGVSREELIRVLGEIQWTEAESRELRKAMDAATEVFGYAGGD
jgi:antitoxin (DNA-binding transcriptional repressor) of toxin-antitoxin stability system